jgi:hypothetical protein
MPLEGAISQGTKATEVAGIVKGGGMSIFPKFLRTIIHAEEVVRAGFARAGVIGEELVDIMMTAFLEGEGQAAFEDAAFTFAIDYLKTHGKEIIDLGDGWIFIADESIDLPVDYTITPEEIQKRSALPERDWRYLGMAPTATGLQDLKAVIGHLNRTWTDTQVTTLLAKTGCPLRGSGAWVREAFLAVRPNHDRQGSIFFLDNYTSRWQQVRIDHLCFPSLQGDNDGTWGRDVAWSGVEQGITDRLCLVRS